VEPWYWHWQVGTSVPMELQKSKSGYDEYFSRSLRAASTSFFNLV